MLYLWIYGVFFARNAPRSIIRTHGPTSNSTWVAHINIYSNIGWDIYNYLFISNRESQKTWEITKSQTEITKLKNLFYEFQSIVYRAHVLKYNIFINISQLSRKCKILDYKMFKAKLFLNFFFVKLGKLVIWESTKCFQKISL